jgi:2'-5' RNA ligase superfamily
MADRPLETAITLILDHFDPELAAVHDELYPIRAVEGIPLSLTLLYPWIPAAEVTETDLEDLGRFFASRPPLEFDLVEVVEMPGKVVYARPEPEDQIRATMRALWAKYPGYPPYGEPGADPPPHCTLGRLYGEDAITLQHAIARAWPLLPVHCAVTEATVQEEYEIDRVRTLRTLPFGD